MNDTMMMQPSTSVESCAQRVFEPNSPAPPYSVLIMPPLSPGGGKPPRIPNHHAVSSNSSVGSVGSWNSRSSRNSVRKRQQQQQEQQRPPSYVSITKSPQISSTPTTTSDKPLVMESSLARAARAISAGLSGSDNNSASSTDQSGRNDNKSYPLPKMRQEPYRPPIGTRWSSAERSTRIESNGGGGVSPLGDGSLEAELANSQLSLDQTQQKLRECEKKSEARRVNLVSITAKWKESKIVLQQAKETIESLKTAKVELDSVKEKYQQAEEELLSTNDKLRSIAEHCHKAMTSKREMEDTLAEERQSKKQVEDELRRLEEDHKKLQEEMKSSSFLQARANDHKEIAKSAKMEEMLVAERQEKNQIEDQLRRLEMDHKKLQEERKSSSPSKGTKGTEKSAQLEEMLIAERKLKMQLEDDLRRLEKNHKKLQGELQSSLLQKSYVNGRQENEEMTKMGNLLVAERLLKKHAEIELRRLEKENQKLQEVLNMETEQGPTDEERNSTVQIMNEIAQTELLQLREKQSVTQAELRNLSSMLTQVTNQLMEEQTARAEVEKALAAERANNEASASVTQGATTEMKQEDKPRPTNQDEVSSPSNSSKLKNDLQKVKSRSPVDKKMDDQSNEEEDKSSPRKPKSLMMEWVQNTAPSTPEKASNEGTETDQTTPSSTSSQHTVAVVGLDDSGEDSDQSKERLEAELRFVASAYGKEEAQVLDRTKVIRHLQLPTDRSNVVQIDFSLTIPEGYPSSDTLFVDVELSSFTPCASIIRSAIFDALYVMVRACRMEARALEGNEAIMSILSIAENWVQSEWPARRSKLFPVQNVRRSGSRSPRQVEICQLVVYARRIDSVDEIKYMKRAASKLHLGGYIKTGKPGLIVVEGLEDDCEKFLSRMIRVREKLSERLSGTSTEGPISTFVAAGKVFAKGVTLDSSRSLPTRMVELRNQGGTEELMEACGSVQLNEIIKGCRR